MAKEDIEKIIKGVKSEIKKEFKTQTRVLLEEFQHRVSGIGEQYNGIQKTLDSHTEQIANILVDVKSVRLDMNDIRYKTDVTLDRKVDKKLFVDLDSRVRNLEKK
jgi:hypothetical protein